MSHSVPYGECIHALDRKASMTDHTSRRQFRPGRRRARTSALAASLVGGLVLAPGAVATAVADPLPEPGPAGHGTTASGAPLSVSVASSEDGHGPFTPGDDSPGADSSARNGLVRTADAVTWSVAVAAPDGAADDVVVRLESLGASVFDRVPSECGPGSAVRSGGLECHLGALDRGVTVVPVVTGVPQTSLHGDAAQVRATVSTSGGSSASADSDALRVSAAPRWDLSASATTPGFERVALPDGTPGFRVVYPVTLAGSSIVPAQGTLGLERLAGDVTFVDDVSRMGGDGPSQARLLEVDGAPACGVNEGQVPGLPAGRGGGETGVVDSGTITCTQSAPGEPVQVTIRGVDSSLDSVPAKNVAGGAVVGGVKPYVVSGYLSLWVPEPPANVSFTAHNAYRDLVAPSASGQADYPGGAEPLGNNVVDRNIGLFEGVVGSQRYWGTRQGTASTYLASGRYDQPYVTPGQDVLVEAGLRNTGTVDWSGTTLCTVFDREVQSLRQVGAAWTSQSVAAGRPSFAAFGSSDPVDLRDATCDDAGDTWFDDPTDVPGGPDAVGKVRWTYDHPADALVGVRTFLHVHEDLADLTRLRSFTSVRTVAGGAWWHDRNPADEANGGWADFLTVTADLARITTKVVDPGSDAATTPDATQYGEAGRVVTFALYPTITNATGDGLPDDLVVEELVPVGSEYVPGSASVAPTTVDTVTDDQGEQRQRLTWRLPGLHANDAVPPITLDVQLGARLGQVVSEARVSWSRDVSPARYRRAERGLHVLAGAGFSVREDVDAPRHVVGDDVTFTLRQQDLASTPLPTSSLVTVLPFDGDGRGTDTGGRVVLGAPVAPAAAGEVVRYTAADPASVPADPGVTGPTWCTGTELGTDGCPASLDAVTAVRVDRTSPIAPGEVVLHDLVVRVEGGRPDAVVASDHVFRSQGVDVPVRSQTVTSAFVSGALGDRVWLDLDEDGLQDDDEPGLEGVTVTVTGTDDRGAAVATRATTDADGHWLVDALRPGSYVVDTGRAEHGWTRAHVGDDPALDSDVDQDGRADAELVTVRGPGDVLEGVARDLDVDAGALPEDDEVVTPPVVEPPVDGGDDGSPAVGGGGPDADAGVLTPDASPAPTATAPRRLAFTGGALGLAGLVAAAAALVAGGAMAARRRREG